MCSRWISYQLSADMDISDTVSSTNIGTLVNMSKGSCENKSALFILFIFYSKIHKIPTYHWSKTIESGAGDLIVK